MVDQLKMAVIVCVAATALPAGWASARIAGVYGERPIGRMSTVLLVGVTLIAFAWALMVMPMGMLLAATLVMAWLLITLAAVDLGSFRLPDLLTGPLVLTGLAVAFILPGAPVLDHIVGAAAGYGVLAALGWLFERLRGQQGIGLGDAKLLGAAGAWLGWRPLPSVLIIACGAAFVWMGLAVIVKGRSVLRERIAFGVPLCAGLWLVWLYGPLSL